MTPKIIRGICEFCGIPATECPHFSEQAPVKQQLSEIEIKPVEKRKGDPFAPKAADMIIAHWDRADMLYQNLKELPITGLNVVVVRGHTYAVANNLGVRAAITENIIFCNDDMVVPKQTLIELVSSNADFAMARQFYPDGKPQHCGLKWVDNDFVVVTDPAEAVCPTAACYRVKKEVFERLGGYNEKFINGGEDHDLFFRAMEAGCTFEFVDTPVIHYSSQSDGRFDYEAKNFELLREIWPIDRLKKLFDKKI